MNRRLVLSLMLLALVAGCDSTTEPSEYAAHVFFLEAAQLPPGSEATAFTESTITFGPEGVLSVASCNTCDGHYAWDDRQLLVHDLVCTRIACGDRLDLGPWLGEAERIVVSDTDDELVTLAAERDGRLATFSFRVAATD